MKKILKYIIAPAVAILGLASCEEELIPSKDTYGDFVGVTGTFAYIAGGTMPEFEATNAAIQHTPIGELGTVEKTIEVAVTKVQSSDVTITVAEDTSAIAAGYSAFPEGLLNYENTVTIPAGETSASITVSIENTDFARLTDLQYMAVFRIVEATGVQISSNSNEARLYVTTETIDPRDNVVSVAEATHTFTVNNYTDTQTGDQIAFTVGITGTEPAFREFEVTLEVDNSLIDGYNELNGTEYLPLPDGILTFGECVMAEDAMETSAAVSVSQENMAELTDAPGYLAPIKVGSAGESTAGMDATVYLVINVNNFDFSADLFSALYLADKEMACWYKFQEGIDMTDGFLYVFHMFIDENVGQQRVGNIADTDEYWINMLRLGQRNDGEELEWWVGPNGNRKNLYAKVTAGEWHQIGLYYDGDSYVFYVDQTEQARYDLTDEDKAMNSEIVFQGIEFANSWGDNYRSAFNGRIWNYSI